MQLGDNLNREITAGVIAGDFSQIGPLSNALDQCSTAAGETWLLDLLDQHSCEAVRRFVSLPKSAQSLNTWFEIQRLRRPLLELLTQKYPHDPHHWLILAEYYFGTDQDFGKAESAIEVAKIRAAETGDFFRQVVGVAIRIALKQKDFAAVEEGLRTLLIYRPVKGHVDIEIESDFLTGLKTGDVDGRVEEEYRALVAKRESTF